MMKECPLLLSPSLCTEQISSANIYFPSPNDQIGKQGSFISANYRKFLTISCISWTTVESSYFSPEVAEFLRFNITILVLITIHVKFYSFCLWCEAGGEGGGRWAGEVEGGRGGLLRGAIVCSVEWSIVSWASDSSFCLFKHHQHRLDHWDNTSGESHIKIILKSWLAAKFTTTTAVATFKCHPRPSKTFKKNCPDMRS